MSRRAGSTPTAATSKRSSCSPRLLELAPLHPEASALASECRQALEHECLAAVGSPSAVLVVALSPQELKRFNLDNVSGFLLSVMDGATDVETILDIAGPTPAARAAPPAQAARARHRRRGVEREAAVARLSENRSREGTWADRSRSLAG